MGLNTLAFIEKNPDLEKSPHSLTDGLMYPLHFRSDSEKSYWKMHVADAAKKHHEPFPPGVRVIPPWHASGSSFIIVRNGIPQECEYIWKKPMRLDDGTKIAHIQIPDPIEGKPAVIVFMLNDLIHELKNSPKTVAWAISHPAPDSDKEARRRWIYTHYEAAKQHGEKELHPQSIEVIDPGMEEKFFVAGGNCIYEAKLVHKNKRIATISLYTHEEDKRKYVLREILKKLNKEKNLNKFSAGISIEEKLIKRFIRGIDIGYQAEDQLLAHASKIEII